MEKINIKDWVCTDPSTNQYRNQLSPMVFEFREDRIINPETKEKETVERLIDLSLYSDGSIKEACLPFGYTKEEIENWWNTGENLEIIAECVFEMDMEPDFEDPYIDMTKTELDKYLNGNKRIAKFNNKMDG